MFAPLSWNWFIVSSDLEKVLHWIISPHNSNLEVKTVAYIYSLLIVKRILQLLNSLHHALLGKQCDGDTPGVLWGTTRPREKEKGSKHSIKMSPSKRTCFLLEGLFSRKCGGKLKRPLAHRTDGFHSIQIQNAISATGTKPIRETNVRFSLLSLFVFLSFFWGVLVTLKGPLSLQGRIYLFKTSIKTKTTMNRLNS